ncbi:cytochrome P450 monooxygenase CYP63 [Sistotremastrum niveocremeum HHB9708]|uniref:Cytochrome P450 monooxygenase CYP63 n=1 Tax=Sistotremastrum niveocremeum HHB9708 TaxID=1314777 RepID=A0A164S1R4_9AGAM|nr:cytochrome P450 monooxygenase CYP63 [Sistotremastrum niveocremeum HHB9708]
MEGSKQAREAERLGAIEIPKVVGRWPGNLDIMIAAMKGIKERYLQEYLDSLFEEYQSDTINLRLLWGDHIFTRDDNVIKCVVSSGFDKFERGRKLKEICETVLGDGIFNTDGDTWRMHRAMTRPFFVKERISDFEFFEQHTARTLDILKGFGKTAIDAQDLFARFTLDTASSFLFGETLGTLLMPLPQAGKAKLGPKGSAIEGEFGEFAQAFEEAQQLMSTRARLGNIWPLIEMFGDKTAKAVAAINRYLGPMVRTVLQENRQDQSSGYVKAGEETNFLQYMSKKIDDPKMIRDELLSILLASRDSTSSLLTFVIYFLAQYPDVLARVREEVLTACPPGKVPAPEDLRQLEYLRAVLNETLRLFPPVPIIPRASASKATVIPRAKGKPYYMPASTPVFSIIFLLQRHAGIWGKDVNDFDPNRWLDERMDLVIKNPFIFLPFSAGPRVCVGQQFAINEASFFLVRLLQEFDSFELTPEFQPEGSRPPASWKKEGRGRAKVEKVWPATALTLYAKGGLWVRFGKST